MLPPLPPLTLENKLNIIFGVLAVAVGILAAMAAKNWSCARRRRHHHRNHHASSASDPASNGPDSHHNFELRNLNFRPVWMYDPHSASLHNAPTTTTTNNNNNNINTTAAAATSANHIPSSSISTTSSP